MNLGLIFTGGDTTVRDLADIAVDVYLSCNNAHQR